MDPGRIVPLFMAAAMFDLMAGCSTDANHDPVITGITGQAASGTWKTKVYREARGFECCVDDAEIEVYYRY